MSHILLQVIKYYLITMIHQKSSGMNVSRLEIICFSNQAIMENRKPWNCEIPSQCFLLTWHTILACSSDIDMMASSNGSIFRVTGHLCGEFTGHWWLPHTKASDTDLWCFLWSAPDKRLSKQSWGWWFETLSCSLWGHCNDFEAEHIHLFGIGSESFVYLFVPLAYFW